MAHYNKYKFWKRLIDIFFSSSGIIIFFLPLTLIGILIKISSRGPIIHWSNRIGLNNSYFRMAKLRTMKINTPVIPSNLSNLPDKYFIRFGKFLRKSGIDELPQLYNILIGEMSFVGPRPVIINDSDLISERTKRGINILKPGLTGLAQINGRDKLSVFDKIKYEEIYMQNMSFVLDMKIILFTNYFLLNENILSKRIKNDIFSEKVKGTDL